MSIDINCAQFDFLASDFKGNRPKVKILAKGVKKLKGASAGSYGRINENTDFILRWHVSIQGECAPDISSTEASENGPASPLIYRYDWAFGITLVEGYYWDWQDALCAEGALSIQIIIQPIGEKIEAIPMAGVLSALHPSRNTKGFFETAGPKISRAAAEMTETGASALPFLKYASTALVLGSNLLESRTNDQRNWFLYQFLDEKLLCPVVEWRINRQVMKEYGPLLRGSLFLAFYGSATPGKIRLLLRPQIRTYSDDSLAFIVPSNELSNDEQPAILVSPSPAN